MGNSPQLGPTPSDTERTLAAAVKCLTHAELVRLDARCEAFDDPHRSVVIAELEVRGLR